MQERLAESIVQTGKPPAQALHEIEFEDRRILGLAEVSVGEKAKKARLEVRAPNPLDFSVAHLGQPRRDRGLAGSGGADD